jgi:hypothetical protein
MMASYDPHREARKPHLQERLLSDTTPEAEAVLVQLLRAKSPAEKVKIVCDLNETVRLLAMSGLRKRYPESSETALKRLYASLVLGDELAEKVYGPLPADE